MSIRDCQLVELQFESICSDLVFFLHRSTCDYPFFRHATKKIPIEVQGGEQWTGEKKYNVPCTMYQVRSMDSKPHFTTIRLSSVDGQPLTL